MRRAALGLLLVTLALSLGWVRGASAGPQPGPIADVPGLAPGYLGFCKSRPTPAREWSCYVINLRRLVLKSRDPANELPQLDALARRSSGFLEANCHMMMHIVGRAYALAHRVTLATLQRYLPHSNDPGCSAGFGMGLVMGLAPQLLAGGPGVANKTCTREPTRFRQYTCYHALGHAYMRIYHGYLSSSLTACHALGRQAPDCAQGSFHDFWLGLAGQDGALYTNGEPKTARALCARQQGIYVLACWYRYYLALPPRHAPSSAVRIDALCRGLTGGQRAGCIAAASLVSNPDPVVQFRICSHLLDAADVDACLRAVGTQNLPDAFDGGVKLIARCRTLASAARAGCYTWFGTALTVLTDGRFAKAGCKRIGPASGRAECVAGSKRIDDPLVTFV